MLEVFKLWSHKQLKKKQKQSKKKYLMHRNNEIQNKRKTHKTQNISELSWTLTKFALKCCMCRQDTYSPAVKIFNSDEWDEPSNDFWECPACTLHNAIGTNECAACNQPNKEYSQQTDDEDNGDGEFQKGEDSDDDDEDGMGGMRGMGGRMGGRMGGMGGMGGMMGRMGGMGGMMGGMEQMLGMMGGMGGSVFQNCICFFFFFVCCLKK